MSKSWRDAALALMDQMRIEQLQAGIEDKDDLARAILDEIWFRMFDNLVKYKEKYGNCDVPRSYSDVPKLGLWVSRQRYFFDYLDSEKQSKLMSIGFDLDPLGTKWTSMFSDLAEFQKINNHCRVPLKYEASPLLGGWIRRQRQQWGNLSESQRDKLLSINFIPNALDAQWNAMFLELVEYKEQGGSLTNYSKNRRLGRWVSKQINNWENLSVERKKLLLPFNINSIKQDFKWESMFNALLDYKKIHGNCNVPTVYKDNPKLGSWVVYQRTTWERMSSKNRERLQEIGFDPDPRGSRWEEMFELLCKYRSINGNCDVPSNFSDDKILGSWVSVQRKNWDRMPQHRRDKLKEIGFSDKLKRKR